MRKTVTFTAQTLEVSERIAAMPAYREALARIAGTPAHAADSESARLRLLAELGARTVMELAEDAGYRELAQLYSEEEEDVYREFQEPGLARRPRGVEEGQDFDALLDALSEL